MQASSKNDNQIDLPAGSHGWLLERLLWQEALPAGWLLHSSSSRLCCVPAPYFSGTHIFVLVLSCVGESVPESSRVGESVAWSWPSVSSFQQRMLAGQVSWHVEVKGNLHLSIGVYASCLFPVGSQWRHIFSQHITSLCG